MKFHIEKEDLLFAIQAVERAVSAKNTLPILSGILIQAQDNYLQFRATDMNMAIQCTVNADIIEEGEVVVPGKKFAGLARLLPSTNIYCATNEKDHLIVKYDNSHMLVPTFDPEEFPDLPRINAEISGNIPAPTFRRLVRQVSVAVSLDSLRPVFTGVLMDIHDDELVFVATDTHRLAMGRGNWQKDKAGDISLIVPCKTLQEIARMAVNDDEPVIFAADQNQVCFTIGNTTFVSRVIVGQYPDYHQVLPTEDMFVTHGVVNNRALTSSLERALLLSRDITKGKGSMAFFDWKDNTLNITADTPDEGSIHEELPIVFSGEELEVSYNARYLLEALKVIDGEQVSFRMTGANTPGIIRSADNGEGAADNADEYLYLILPIRISK